MRLITSTTRALVLGLLIQSAVVAGCAEDDATTSTVGTDATDATDAADASDAADGTDGTTAPDGSDGTDGTDASDGADATDGTDGTDGEPICTPGQETCNGTTRVVCSADGSQLNSEPCDNGCKFGKCVEACTPNSATCDGDVLVTCSADGVETKTPCDSGCADAKCNTVEPVCEGGKVFCDVGLKAIVECAPDGLTAQKKEACPFGCADGASTCSEAACEVGETRCAADDDKVVELCLEDQSGWKKAEQACKVSCKDGSCFVPTCEPGASECGVLGVEVCNDEGTGFEVKELCKSGCAVTPEGPACKQCKKGLKQCDGKTIEVCNDEVVGFVAESTCTDIQACQNGACVDMAVLSDANTAEANYLILMKAMAKCFAAGVEGSCRAIDTTGLTKAITIDDLETWFCENEEDEAFQASFGTEADFIAATDIIGTCGFLVTNLQDLTFEQDEVQPGKNAVQCIGFSDGGFISNGKELIVDLCSAFK